jgi:hypothetical protein
MVIPCELSLVPHSAVHFAVYVPDSDTCIVRPLDPLLQLTVPLQPEAVKVAFSPSQQIVLSVLIVGIVGVVFVPIIIVFELPEVPQLVVQVAVYVPEPTCLLEPTPKPDDQVIVPPSQPVAVMVALSGTHTLVTLLLKTGAVGGVPVVIVTELEADDVPHELTHVAVYVPMPTSFVAPVPNVPDHVIVPSAQPVAVNVAFSVPQTIVLFADITGATGAGLVVIVTVFEFGLFPQIFSQ